MKHKIRFKNVFRPSIATVGVAVVMSFVACQSDDEDVVAISSNIAQKTLLGTYVHLAIDSVAVNTTLNEWMLENSDAGGRTGYHQLVSTGNQMDGQDVVTNLTWEEATMSQDRLSMTIPISFADGSTSGLTWRNGVIEIDGQYATTKQIVSLAAILRNIRDNITDMELVGNDTTFFTKQVMIHYLAWKSKVDFFDAADTLRVRDSLLNTIVGLEDTLIWFIKNHPEARLLSTQGGPLVYDSVNNAIVSAVVVNKTASTKGKNAGKHAITYLVSAEDSVETTVKVGYASILNCDMHFKREGKSNTATFTYRNRQWTEQCYTADSTTAKATSFDSTYTVTDALWTPAKITNVKTFTILLKGKESISSIRTVGNVEKSNTSTVKEGTFVEIPLSAFESEKVDNKGNAISVNAKYNGINLKLK